jgi:hypothetical protein
MTIYCANCETEATYVNSRGTPLCSTCREAYTWGQSNPQAETYDIDELKSFRHYLKRWEKRHGAKKEVWDGRKITVLLDFMAFMAMIEELDTLEYMLERPQQDPDSLKQDCRALRAALLMEDD